MITYSSLSVIKFSPGISIVSIALPSNLSIVEVTRMGVPETKIHLKV